MSNSFSRPDPSSPASVSAAQFPRSRRGYDQSEVRDFLRMVAAEMARLQERERFLERELGSARQAGPADAAVIDEDTATRLLGEEAARILQTAREGAAQIRTRAEDGSARLLRETTDEAQRLREEAEIEAARRRQDASADAEAEVQMAKQQGRDMVNEARSYRERVLSELARRRELARQQIEQLIHGRDRLLQAFERSRIAAVEVMAELTPLGEPSEYVNLQLTTGPIPIMVESSPMTRPGSNVGGGDDTQMYDVESESESDDDDARNLPPREFTVAIEEAEPADPAEAVGTASGMAPGEETGGEAGEKSGGEKSGGQPGELHIVREPDDTVVSFPPPAPAEETSQDDDREPAQVVALFAGEIEPSETRNAGTVNDLFARLRAARTEGVTSRSEAGVVDPDRAALTSTGDLVIVGEELDAPATAPAGAAGPLDASAADEVVVPLIVSAARKLKRVLADEQNEVLDTLRRKEPVRAIDTLLPWEAEQSARYATAVEADLLAAAVAGAGGGENGSNPAIVRPARDAVTNEIVAPLRERLTRCIDKAGGDNADLANQVRSLYREWKTHRIDEHVEDIIRLAYNRGALTIASR